MSAFSVSPITPAEKPHVRMPRKSWWIEYVQVLAATAVLAFIVTFFSISADSFFSSNNLVTLLQQLAPILIVAAVNTLVITTAGIDLSVGSILGLTGGAGALLMSQGVSPTLALVVMFGIGAAIGLINGVVSAYMNVPPFIVTLAMMILGVGVALMLTKGYPIPIDDSAWILGLGQGSFIGIPMPLWIALPIVVMVSIVFTRTSYGGYIVGVGSNMEAVRRSGVNVDRVVVSVYVLSGIAAAIAGILMSTRLGSGSATVGTGFELQVIAAVVLGGTSLFGGRGSVFGSVIGVLIIGVIGNGLILLHLEIYYVQISQGIVLLLAIIFNTWISKRLSRG